MVFSTMLKQEVAWFDDPGNSTGALCSRLSSDASSVQGVSNSNFQHHFAQKIIFKLTFNFRHVVHVCPLYAKRCLLCQQE